VQGAVGSLRLDVIRFPSDWLGFEIGMRVGPVGSSVDARWDGGFEAAVDLAPLRWEGRWGGALILGAGAGVGSVRPVWLDEEVHAYPFALGRARFFPSRDLGLHAAFRFTPITTDALRVQAYELEAAVSVGLFQVGARGRIDLARGGDPERTYGGYWIGPFVGIGVY